MSTKSTQPPNVPVPLLNTIYNACDVGINTCKGEGHGLVNHEHAACRVAQVVPDHTSCKEIFEGAGELINNLFIDVDPNLNRDMPIPDPAHLAEILGQLYDDPKHLKDVADRCYERATSEMYQWNTIAMQLNDVFKEALAEEAPAIKKKKKDKKGFQKRKKELVKA